MATKKVKKTKSIASKKAVKSVVKSKVKAKPAKSVKVASKTKASKILDKHVSKPIGKVSKMFSKGEFYSAIAGQVELNRKQVAAVFDALSEIIAAHLKKDGPEKFVLPGLLKIVVKKVPAKPAREGRNPFTGETMTFKAKPASKKVKVMALRHLKSMC